MIIESLRDFTRAIKEAKIASQDGRIVSDSKHQRSGSHNFVLENMKGTGKDKAKIGAMRPSFTIGTIENKAYIVKWILPFLKCHLLVSYKH